MAVVYLLSAADFKTYTPVHGNVDDKFIQQSILACQDMYVVEIIGTDLYNKLITDCPNVTGNYKILLQDYLHKGMRYWIMAEIGSILSRRFTNIGFQEKYSENSSNVDRENLLSDYGNLMNKAEYFADRTRKYLCANETLFPEYLTSGTKDDDILPKKDLFKSSIYLGGIRRNYSNFERIDDDDDCCS
jgi:hypothetical protein